MVYSILLALSLASSMAGDWQVVFHQQGGTQYWMMHLDQDGDKVSGALSGDQIKFKGAIHGDILEMELREGDRPPGKFKATVKGSTMSAEGEDPDGPFTFTASRTMARDGAPKTIKFTPEHFYNYFSSTIVPVQRIFPGDTVETKSVDAGGVDENGVRRAPGGNPLTGPFYVEGAWPDDVLVVKLNRLRLNRGTAGSGRGIVASALNPGYFRGAKMDDNFSSEWTLDREHGVARLTKPSEHLKNYTVALHPMLGCIGVAPPQEQSYRSGFLGAYGGNMDYNQFAEGATLYLPVFHPGALLFLGDGHAAQGDGELTGDALETSMEFSFTVELQKGKGIPGPRAENAQYRMASGIANSLPEAVQQATTSLARWLADDYKLSFNEVSVVFGSAIHYDIAELVDPLVHVVAKIDKKVLAGLQP